MSITQKTITFTHYNKKNIKITVQKPDLFTGLASLEIQTIVYDAYHDRYLEPRSIKIFLTEQEISHLGRFLSSGWETEEQY